ncbi:nitroreductase family protein [Duganella sp. HH105]|uniref:nitroreductase family protein n=1 Tax=Duganella sp. HH105 TaxID=1781067 RepID=UPI000893ED32|nr:hypothetical protein [Duganella sp. HH105]OEZ61255.1 hypothetical protein DUGA6_22810 [Duganella sp. HH105]
MWTLLPDPRPKSEIQPYQPLDWPVGARVPLSVPVDVAQSFCDVIAARRSTRTFGPLSKEDLSALFWYSYRVLARQNCDLGFDLTLRPAPSAGAIHAIHLLSCSAAGGDWQRYDPLQHCLVEVPRGLISVDSALSEVMPAVAPQAGTLLWLAAEVGKTVAKYDSAESLIWRDAGALLAHLGLTASYLGLNFCPLGVTGAHWGRDLDEVKLIRGVGAALVGSPAASGVTGDVIKI